MSCAGFNNFCDVSSGIILATTNLPIPYIVDCKWSDWSFGTCSEKCGGGTRTNTRTEEVSAMHEGKPCAGGDSVEESCNTESCSGYSNRLKHPFAKLRTRNDSSISAANTTIYKNVIF